MILVAYGLLMLSAAWLIGVSIFALFRPKLALHCLGTMASTNAINYTEISLRMLSGFAFLGYAEASRYPQWFVGFGWILVVTSGILFIVPRKWHHQYAVFWSKALTPLLVQLAAPLSLVAGGFLIFAVH